MSDDRPEGESPEPEVYRVPRGLPGWVSEGHDDDVSFVEHINVLLRHRWKVLGLPILMACATVMYTVLQPASYTSRASFMTQTSGQGGQLSRLSGLASQFGVDVPRGQTGQAPQFYANLVTSQRLLDATVTSGYSLGGNADDVSVPGSSEGNGDRPPGEETSIVPDSAAATLLELYGIQANSRAAAIEVARDRLREAVSVSTDIETGVVQLTVTTPWPGVSSQIGQRLIEFVNRFNNRTRRSQASAEAEFVRERLQEAKLELRAAEDTLENFLQRNVGWQQSPALRMEHDRLQRQVSLKQSVYTSLATRYEEARISEVGSTPVVTTITRPEVPARPDPARLPLKAAFGLVLGGVLGVFWAFGSEFLANMREERSEDYREFLSLKESAADDLRRMRARIRRLVSGETNDGSRD